MDSQTLVATSSLFLVAVVSLVVPFQAYRFTLRQEHIRLIREQRATLYTDLLVEAYAERQWMKWWIAGADNGPGAIQFEDLRLPQLERARLGARGTAMASTNVNQLFNELMSVMSRIDMKVRIGQIDSEAAQMVLNVETGRACDALEAAIRAELEAGADLGWPRRRLLRGM